MTIGGKVRCFFEQEEWRDIPKYEGLYKVSSCGRVMSLSRVIRANSCGKRVIPDHILKAGKGASGYLSVTLCKDGKKSCRLVHRIVAEVFIENRNNLKEVNHKDENKCNNSVDNLEWCDRIYNANYGTGVERCRVQKFKKLEMLDMVTKDVIRTFESGKEAEHITGISRKYISLVCHQKKHSAGGFIWRFTNDY